MGRLRASQEATEAEGCGHSAGRSVDSGRAGQSGAERGRAWVSEHEVGVSRQPDDSRFR